MPLKDSEERLRAILETAVSGIITVDERGVIESVNPAAQKLFGYTGQEMVGQNIGVLMPEPFASEHDHYIKKYRDTGKPRIIGVGREVTGRRKDGTVFPMDLAVGEVRLAGERFFTGIVRDLTEARRLEKEILEITDRERQRIGQDLHDNLCQHLAGISLMSEALEQTLSEKSSPEAAEAHRITQHVQGAIEQTRRLARGLSPLEAESADLATALSHLASNTAESAMLVHLYRIAQEAISNAVRHGCASRVTISLSAVDGEGLLSISDNGAGFVEPAKDHDGMGLRIMKYRAGMIGGALEVGQGSTYGVVVSCRFRPA